MDTQFLSIKEAADYLQVDYKVVYRLVKEGRIPATRVGWQFRIMPADIDAYLDSQRAPHHPDSPDDRKPFDADKSSASDLDMALFTSGEPLAKPAIKSLEEYVISMFIRRVGEIDAFQHPLTGALISLRNGTQHYTITDERLRLLDILETAFLDRQTLATTPLNVQVRYDLDSAPPIALVLKFVAHLETLCTAGQDSQPASLDNIGGLLEAAREDGSTATIVACVSPTGWTEAAMQAARVADRPGADHLLLYLVDIRNGTIHFNATSTFARRLASLFDFVRPAM